MARRQLACAHPNCRFLLHEDHSFGGWCCKRCHWAWYTQSRHRHGERCARVLAPPDAPNATPIPPVAPLEGAIYIDEDEDHEPPPLGEVEWEEQEEDEEEYEEEEEEEQEVDEEEYDLWWGHWGPHAIPDSWEPEPQREMTDWNQHQWRPPTADRGHTADDEAAADEHAGHVPGQQHTDVASHEQPDSAGHQSEEDEVIQINSEIQIVSPSGPWARFHALTGWVVGCSDAGAYHIHLVDGNIVFSVTPDRCILVSDTHGHEETDSEEPCGSETADLPVSLPTNANAGVSSSSSADGMDYVGVSAVGAAVQPITEGAKVQLKCIEGKGLAVINGEVAQVVNIIDDLYDLSLDSGFHLLGVAREYFDVVVSGNVAASENS